MISPCSNWGLIKDLELVSKLCRGNSLRRRPTPFKVLLILLFMQLVNDSFSFRVSPRCLWATDLSTD